MRVEWGRIKRGSSACILRSPLGEFYFQLQGDEWILCLFESVGILIVEYSGDLHYCVTENGHNSY